MSPTDDVTTVGREHYRQLRAAVARLTAERDALRDRLSAADRVLALAAAYAADPAAVRATGVTGVPWLDAILSERDALRAALGEISRLLDEPDGPDHVAAARQTADAALEDTARA